MEITPAHARELEKQRLRKEALLADCERALDGCQSLFFEAGCGHGHWLTSYAEAHPDQVCLGIDLIALRIRKAQAKGDKRGLKNLHFLKAELGEFLEVLPPEVQFDGIILLFPDPWPKARHHRRRMVQQDMLTELARRTRPDGCFYFRTDDREYFDWTLEHLDDNPYWLIEKEAAWPHEKETYFQGLMDNYYSVVARLRNDN
ncbi:MAG: tRNA (guanosine(46)-N7)-methyltransferase TrmB [Coraliomargaritaceae bacterium]